MIDTEKARDELKKAFGTTEVCTQYIAIYTTPSGREIALERNRSEALYVWLERFDIEIEGITVRNQKFPGQPYDSKQPRNSNLNDKNAPRLKVGNKVWYLKVESMEALRALIAWYAKI